MQRVLEVREIVLMVVKVWRHAQAALTGSDQHAALRQFFRQSAGVGARKTRGNDLRAGVFQVLAAEHVERTLDAGADAVKQELLAAISARDEAVRARDEAIKELKATYHEGYADAIEELKPELVKLRAEIETLLTEKDELLKDRASLWRKFHQ